MTTPEQRADVVGYLRMYGTAPLQVAADLLEADAARIAELEALVRDTLEQIKNPAPWPVGYWRDWQERAQSLLNHSESTNVR